MTAQHEIDRERVTARISLSRIRDNFDWILKGIPQETRALVVVKADGYGHGAGAVARALQTDPRVFGFAIATAGEALSLIREGIEKPMLILGYVFPEAHRVLADADVRLSVFDDATLSDLARIAKERQESGDPRPIRVHLPVDTGMGRIGVRPDAEGVSFAKRLFQTPGILVEGIFTHFATADEEDLTFAREQAARFRSFTEALSGEVSLDGVLLHAANSAASLQMPEVSFDLIRAGIALYGLKPSEETKRTEGLMPVLTLESHVSFVKTLPAGSPVSYGATYVTPGERVIATVPVGYADGYPRALSGKGEVLVRGKRAPICGRICMDQFMIDVTEIPGVTAGDPVTLIGTDGEETITVEELADRSGRFHYEWICDIAPRVPRLYEG